MVITGFIWWVIEWLVSCCCWFSDWNCCWFSIWNTCSTLVCYQPTFMLLLATGNLIKISFTHLLPSPFFVTTLIKMVSAPFALITTHSHRVRSPYRWVRSKVIPINLLKNTCPGFFLYNTCIKLIILITQIKDTCSQIGHIHSCH